MYLFVRCLLILYTFNSQVSFVVYSLSLSVEIRRPLPPLRSLRYAGGICDTIDELLRVHVPSLEHGETLFDVHQAAEHKLHSVGLQWARIARRRRQVGGQI